MISKRVRFATLYATVVGLLLITGCPQPKGPTAVFTADPTSGVAPLTVQFTDRSLSGRASITDRLWEFGDSAIDTTQHPAHDYVNPGSYTVALTVTTALGIDTRVMPNYIVVSQAGEPNPPDGLVEVPNPTSGDNPTYKLESAAVPTPGQSVTDNRFGTTQTRIVQTERIRQEYSRHDPFNKDQSMILFMYLPDGEWRVYRTASIPYDTTANLVRTLDMEEPRWDPANPDLIWGNQEFRILTVNVKTGDTTVIKDFAQDAAIKPVLTAHPDLYRITMKDEGESSYDRRFWAYQIQGSQDDYRARYLFTWDRQQDKILGLYTLPANESSIDWVGMSPKGNWVLIGADAENEGQLAGLTMANKELTQFHRLNFDTAHSDVGLDSDGNEVIVMQNTRTDYIDLIPIDLNTKPILENGGEYAGTNHVPVVRLFCASESPIGLNSGVHISCNFNGYAVVSTYIEPGLPEQNWLDRSIILVKLDRAKPRAYYLSKVYGTTGAYWEETQASITNDGTKVVWATNWDQHVGEERVWVVQLDMPEGWAKGVSGRR